MSEKAFGHAWFTKKMLLKNKKFWLTAPCIQAFKVVCTMSSDYNAILSEEKSAATLVFVALYEMCLFSSKCSNSL